MNAVGLASCIVKIAEACTAGFLRQYNPAPGITKYQQAASEVQHHFSLGTFQRELIPLLVQLNSNRFGLLYYRQALLFKGMSLGDFYYSNDGGTEELDFYVEFIDLGDNAPVGLLIRLPKARKRKHQD